MPLCKFEVLTYAWCDGFANSYLNEADLPVTFDCIEDALEDLQDDFDIWANQVRSGERDPDNIFCDDEYLIRCIDTGSGCKVKLVLGTLFLTPDEGKFLRH